MAQVKYATVEILEALTQKAEDSGKNRYPDVGIVNGVLLDLGYDLEEVKLPITYTLDHNDVEVRAMFVIPGPDPEANERFFLDMEYEDYNNHRSPPAPNITFTFSYLTNQFMAKMIHGTFHDYVTIECFTQMFGVNTLNKPIFEPLLNFWASHFK